jgi:putative phosphoesterase
MSVLGVLGDTHGRADAATRAVQVLRQAGATEFLHTGDVGDYVRSPEPVFDALAGTNCRFVWGNNDVQGPERTAAEAYARDLDLVPLGDCGVVELAGLRVRIEHGDDLRELRRLSRDATSGRDVGCDLLLTGHSHLVHDRRLGKLRWINPGALFRAATLTVAVIELPGLAARALEVPR